MMLQIGVRCSQGHINVWNWSVLYCLCFYVKKKKKKIPQGANNADN